jgi:hypothetical protein
MNCLEFRRLKLADPHNKNNLAATHAAQCGQCAEFSHQVDAMEDKIVQQLNSVQIPNGLADKILLAGKLQKPKRHGWMLVPAFLAIICSVFIFYPYFLQYRLTNIVLAHVIDEPDALTVNENISSEKLAQVLTARGIHLKGSLGKVRVIRNCPMPGGFGDHIVVETQYGLATLLVLPASLELAAASNATKDHFSVALLPTGQHNIGVVVDSSVNLEKTVQLVQQQLSWPEAPNKQLISLN